MRIGMIDKVQKIREEVERLKSRICNNHFLCDYEKGCNDGREDICDDLISFIDSLQEEPVSEDLEKEIKRYQQEVYDRDATVKDVAHHFANWQKQQDKETIEVAEDHAMLAGRMQMKEELMKDAMYLTCCGSHAFSACWCMENVDTSCYKAGDRLKIIVVKED